MGKVTRVAVTLLVSFVLILPIYQMLMGSVQSSRVIMRMPPAVIPIEFTIESYRRIFALNPIGRWVLNSVMIGSVTVVVAGLCAALAGYALASYKFPGRQVIYWSFLAALMMPRLSLIIPQYVTIRKLGLAHGYFGAGLPLLFFPIGVVLFRLFMEALPKSIDDAARMDGASEWQTIVHIIIPLCGPALGLLAITKAFESFGDYLWQSLILTRQAEQTLIVGMVDSMRRRGTQSGESVLNPIGIQLASGTILFLPMVVIFLIGQRWFKSGLTGGAVKE